MRAAVVLLLLPGLAACATPAPSAGPPTRDDMAAALRAWMTCDEALMTNCVSPPDRIVVRTLRCRPAGEGERLAQILCRFSYSASYPWQASPRVECAWLSRNPEGAWQIESWPDADVCETSDA